MEQHNIRVEILTPEYKDWFVNVACVRMLTEEVKRPELVNIDHLYSLLDRTMCLVALKEDIPIGATAFTITPNLYNPNIVSLVELFWYVLPEYRKTRAGFLLIKELENTASQIANDLIISILPHSDINIKSLEKRGYKLEEYALRKVINHGSSN